VILSIRGTLSLQVSLNSAQPIPRVDLPCGCGEKGGGARTHLSVSSTPLETSNTTLKNLLDHTFSPFRIAIGGTCTVSAADFFKRFNRHNNNNNLILIARKFTFEYDQMRVSARFRQFQMHVLDNSSYRLIFYLDKKDEIYHYSSKEHPKISKIAKFGCEML
jgi:hypothetical protein